MLPPYRDVPATPSCVRWSTAFALLLFCACASSGGNPYSQTSASEAISIQVDNESWSDVVVSVRCGTMRRRLGMVPSNARMSFVIPSTLSAYGGEVCFEADPVGSDEAHESPAVVFTGGEKYFWRLANRREQSTLEVR